MSDLGERLAEEIQNRITKLQAERDQMGAAEAAGLCGSIGNKNRIICRQKSAHRGRCDSGGYRSDSPDRDMP